MSDFKSGSYVRVKSKIKGEDKFFFGNIIGTETYQGKELIECALNINNLRVTRFFPPEDVSVMVDGDNE